MAVVAGTNAGLVTVSPTADPAGNDITSDAYSRAVKITTVGAVTVTEVGWYCANATQAANFEVGIYTHDSGNDIPGDIVHVSRTHAKGTTAGWKKVTGLSWALDATTTYWIAVQLDDTTTQTSMNYSSEAGERIAQSDPDTTLNDPWVNDVESDNFIVAIYALAAAAGTNMEINIGDTWKDVDSIKINIGDTWKDVTKVQINIGDAWKDVFG